MIKSKFEFLNCIYNMKHINWANIGMNINNYIKLEFEIIF